jgi:ADP-ribose pyrophosphatase
MIRFERVKEVVAYENRRVTVFDDEVRRPDGQPGTYFRVRYKNGTSGAVIVPVLPDGRLLLLQIHRYAFDDASIEFPRGSARANETPEETAARELTEETSLKPTQLIAIGHCRPDTSIMQVDAAVFLAPLPAAAEDAVKVQEFEAIESHVWLTREQIMRMAYAGTIRDGFTLSALALYSAYLLCSEEAASSSAAIESPSNPA